MFTARRRSQLTAGTAVLVAVLLLAACDWPQFGYEASRTRYNPTETKVGVGNVAALTTKWTASTGDSSGDSSPAVVNGVVYVGSSNVLRAFDAAGLKNCSGTPKTCAPLWTAAATGSPAVANGAVYVRSGGTLAAFDAAGLTNCSGTPKTCAPLWTAANQFPWALSASPTVANGVVYMGATGFSWNGNGPGRLYAFDAAGTVNCSGTPKTCDPLWTTTDGGSGFSSPAVTNGVVYVSRNYELYAFDAAGTVNCSGTPKTCDPLWTTTTSSWPDGEPAVANGTVYVGSLAGGLLAFDATGTTNCSGTPKTCAPLWTAATGDGPFGSPAVANGVVYVGSSDGPNAVTGKLNAFDAAGTTNCSGTPKTCAPLWTAATISFLTSPAVANGIVYVGGSNFGPARPTLGKLYAFDAAGTVNCYATPKTCAPLWAATTGALWESPAVANGVVYVGSNDDNFPPTLYAFGL